LGQGTEKYFDNFAVVIQMTLKSDFSKKKFLVFTIKKKIYLCPSKQKIKVK